MPDTENHPLYVAKKYVETYFIWNLMQQDKTPRKGYSTIIWIF